MLELHSTYKRHEILMKRNVVSAWCFMKNINVYILGIRFFPREQIRLIEDGAFVLWRPSRPFH